MKIVWLRLPADLKNTILRTTRHSRHLKKKKKNVNLDSHIASSPISQKIFFEKVCCLILAPSQRKLHGYIEILKFDITIKKKKIQISLKIKGLNRFLPNFVWNII